MNGRRVVFILLTLVVLTGGLFWAVGLDTVRGVAAQEAALGVPMLSREDAARRVAREDMFGLPSRIPDAPARDIEQAWKVGTPDSPLPATAEGIATLFEVYAVSVRGCRSQLPDAERAAKTLAVYVTLRDVGGTGRVIAIDGLGEGATTRAFTGCLAGSVQQAVFDAPAGGQLTTSHRLEWD